MSEKSNNQKSTIFIVDISGFTDFVKETENTKGVIIMSELLKSIMCANNLGFQVSEIEGDAILFYRFGKPYPLDILIEQFEGMLGAFKKKILDLKSCSDNVSRLSIKAVAHYGEITRYSIFDFNKLYGKSLIEAHRLLKNNIHQDTYVLVTDEYLNQCMIDPLSVSSGLQQCERYDVGKLCYTYFSYANMLEVIPN